MTSNSYAVRSQYAIDSASQLLTRPVIALIGVSEEGGGVLASLGIETIFDLSASSIFKSVRQILLSASQPPERGIDRVAGDFVDNAFRERSPKALLAAPISAMRSIGDTKAKKIKDILDLSTIHELATWPPYLTACSIFNDAYGMQSSIINDPERPDDLIPTSRRYATEKVQYDIIVMGRVLSKDRGSLHPTIGASVETQPNNDIITSGAIDISNIVSAALVAKPAVGAVLTYRQSWYPQGLALGHLLHSMALAPGESTRIAMVDWTRSIRGTTTDITSQTEALTADVTRTRAMSEVTSSVATEAQRGFSGSTSEGQQVQHGQTSGVAGLVGLAVFSQGTSDAEARSSTNASAWASSSGERSLNAEMTQNITDRTHQAANSVRNRRASTVMETSQAESEKLSTRVVTNYNHMHALTVQYFEVVQIYRVMVELSRVTRCLFLPMKLITFTEDVIRRYRTVIASVGLIPEIRALAFSQPNQIAIVAPNKDGVWAPRHLAEIKQAIGDDVALPNSSTAYLPVTGLELFSVGSYDQKVKDHFAAVAITTRQGVRVRLPLSDLHEGGNAYVPRFSAPIGGFKATDIASLALVKKTVAREEGGDVFDPFTGTFNIILSFDIKLSDGTYVSTKIGAPKLTLEAPVRAKADEPETMLFALRSSLAEADIIQHLTENALHYSAAIWRSLDAATIITMLATYSIGGRYLIETIDPVPVTVNGNYLVFRFYSGENDSEWQEFREKHGLIQPTPVEDLIPLPSGGVFAEAVLGRSNAAEKLDITRFWNWQDSLIPILPSEIAPLQAGGKANDPNIKTSPLEGQVLNIINPPSLPDPAGLAPLYAAIANGNMFRDMSGLAQTASLAQAALQAAQVGAGQATTAAGQAQQVAAQQLTDLLREIGKIALAAMTGGAGGVAGASGGALLGALSGVGNSGVSKNPTNAGALINQGAKMDAVKSGGPSFPSSGDGRSGGNTGIVSGSEDYSRAAIQPSNEETAFKSAVGGGGGVLGQVLSFAMGATKTTAPAQKTGLSRLANERGKTTGFVQSILDGSKEWIDVVGDGLANWKDSPSTDLSDALTEALLEAAKTAADEATDDIPFVKAMKVAVKYSLVFADGIGVGIDQASKTLSEKYDQAIRVDPGSNGYTQDDLDAINFLRKYQLNNLVELNNVLLQGISAMVDAGIQEIGDWAAGAVVKKFSDVSKSLLAHLLDKSPLKAVICEALDVVGADVAQERREIYRAALSTSLSLFIRQLDNPRLRRSLSGFTKLGGTAPLDKAIVKAIASCFVDAAAQDLSVRRFTQDVKAETRDWVYQHLKTLIGSLPAGVTVVSTNGTLEVAGNEIRIPARLFQAIQLGRQAAEEEDYRKAMDIALAFDEVRKAAEARLTLLSRVRQARLVYLDENADYSAYHAAYTSYWSEIRQECSKLTGMYRAAGVDPDSIYHTTIRFQIFDRNLPRKWYLQTYEIETMHFYTSEVMK